MPSKFKNSFAPSVVFVPAVSSGADTVPNTFENTDVPAFKPYTSTPSRMTTAIIKILKFLEVNFSMRRTCLSIFI